ncbi:DUF2939 domain-containing protein [Gluconobacter kanchanaburiensis]|uniref:DUF2939 domain-containing protein n=1 Tax=Gluconobacter kanchanaburiensis NBRC 103587 TaxID=1307948 RepID=A0A511BA85_9PROT|nr:DUF2939 domain-containing protein [Gluconobacter kanchanaburiensis]MBF0862511.1 DUF2939 domain-containing protein [Gluconobacter kanchanaburiensis]GBR71764.1 hypothetical protein AA103587_2546 [Gluconobacter kanchanaburiensis NBRC 103587]GEK96632.1 hypothetical protein GKA01_18290 [Gluconobacter kanchanaburiensis NBRC 103587]
MKNGFRKVMPRAWQGLGVSAGAVLAAYVVSPYVALWDIDRAMNGNNPSRLAPHVDWASLSHCLKEQFSPPVPSEDELPGFGSSFAGQAISNAIDTHLTPATLMTTAHQIMPRAASAPGGLGAWNSLHAHFVSLGKFEASMDQPGQTPFVLHMKFENWSWKITRFEMPAPAHRA